MKEYICEFDGEEYVLSPDSERIELVRCRDCVHYKPLDKNRPYSCSVGMDEVTGDDYCSRGAKMEEVTE